MTIAVGDKIPSSTLTTMTADGPGPVSTDEFFAGKKVVLFAVPGAFTPTCSAKHLPGFIEQADEILAKGVDAIACMSVNDVFVMHAWGKDAGVEDKVVMLADGNGDFTKQLGLELDAQARGRRRRTHLEVLDARLVAVVLFATLGPDRPDAFGDVAERERAVVVGRAELARAPLAAAFAEPRLGAQEDPVRVRAVRAVDVLHVRHSAPTSLWVARSRTSYPITGMPAPRNSQRCS